MIRTIVFDMGNVLIYFNKELFLDRYPLSENDRILLRRVVFDSVEWVRLDRGTMTEVDAIAEMNRQLPSHLHPITQELVLAWDQPELFPVPGMYELLEELKAEGYDLYLLSNASRRQHDYWPRIPASRFFTGTLISADHGRIKPDAAIYHLMYQTFRLDPEECFFIDDNPANVESAILTGMKACVFHNDMTELRRVLRANGISVSP